MLNNPVPNAGTMVGPQAVRDAIAQLERDLAQLPSMVEKACATLPSPEDPTLLDQLLASTSQAHDHARRATFGLDAAGPTDAGPTVLADARQLIEEVWRG